MLALAVAYQVQCRLSDVAPVRARGFDHATQGSFAVAAGVSKALGLDETRAVNALAICGTAFNAIRVTRKEEADHSLPFMCAAALLDGQVLPEQYEPERIAGRDVQALLRKKRVYPSNEFSKRFPAEIPVRITIP